MWAGQPGLGQFCQAALLTPNDLSSSSLPLGLDLTPCPLGSGAHVEAEPALKPCPVPGRWRGAESLCTGQAHRTAPNQRGPFLPTEQSGWEPVLGGEAEAVVSEPHLLPSACTNVPDPRAQDPSITASALSWHLSSAQRGLLGSEWGRGCMPGLQET